MGQLRLIDFIWISPISIEEAASKGGFVGAVLDAIRIDHGKKVKIYSFLQRIELDTVDEELHHALD